MSASRQSGPDDRRTVRTRAALNTAFIDLLAGGRYHDLTVADIAAAANVGRSTFYEHFGSKEALLRHSIAGPFGTLADVAGGQTSQDRLEQVLLHFREHRRLGRAILAGAARSALSRCLAELIEARLPRRAPRALLPPYLIAVTIADAQLALVQSWTIGTCAASPHDMAAAILASTGALAASLLGEDVAMHRPADVQT